MSTKSSIEADTAWLAEHSLEICREYAGKWIAVHNGRVVGVGATAVEASETARKVCADDQFVLEAVDGNADAIYGLI